MREKVTVPAWAEKIEVTRKRTSLLVRGIGRMPDLAAFTSEKLGGSQGTLARYIPAVTVGDKRRNRPPHIDFASANNRAAQIEFVAKFGPVWGSVRHLEPTILVRQDLNSLGREQATFQTATELVACLRTPRKDFRQISLLFLELAIEHRIGVPETDAHVNMLLSWEKLKGIPVIRDSVEPTWESEEEGILAWDHGLDSLYEHCAHWTLCRLFNRFSPSLVFFNGRPAELPTHRPEGILPVLYFMLRADYLAADKRIGSCANVNCRTLFAIERAGQRFCSASCSTLQRGRDYWRRAGKKRRRTRRKDKESKKRQN